MTCKHLLQGAPDCVFCHRDQLRSQLSDALMDMEGFKARLEDAVTQNARLRGHLSRAEEGIAARSQTIKDLGFQLGMAEEGLANYAQEVERLKDALRNVRNHGCNECLECCVAINRLIGLSEPQTPPQSESVK